MEYHSEPGGMDAIHEHIGERLDGLVENIADDARRFAAVGWRDNETPGELRDSIATEPGGIIRAGTDHAFYVEKGTYKMAAQPFLRPALFQEREF